MIKQFNKINATAISMWLNILGFVSGIVFYVRMERAFHTGTPAPQTKPVKDSVFVIDTKLLMELKHLRETQDSLLKEVRVNTAWLKKQKKTSELLPH